MLTLLGNPPLCCSRIKGSLLRSDCAFPTTNPTHTSHVNCPSQPTMGSCPFHSLNCGLLPPSIVRHLCRSCPHSLMGSPIYIFSFDYSVPPWGLLPFAVELLPFSLLGTSPSHCLIGAPPSLSMGPFRIALTQVRGSSPSSRGRSSPSYYRGSSPSRSFGSPPCSGPPSLPGAHPHLVHSTVGFPTSLWGSSPSLHGASSHYGALPHLTHSTVGLPHISVGLFSISPWGFISLWGSSPSHSQLWGFPTSLWGSSPSLRRASSHCGALFHLAHGLPHISVGLFTISP